MGRDIKTSLDREDAATILPRGDCGPAAMPRPRVEDIMARDFVPLPPWFPAGKAASVLRHTGKSFARLDGPGGAVLLAGLDALDAAPPSRAVAGCAAPLGPAVALDAGVDEALALMDRHGAERAAVTLDRLLVGVVTREAAVERLLAARPPRALSLAA